MWLRCPIEEQDDWGRKSRRRPASGVPQGGVISPLLSNLYLHWFEVLFHRRDGPAHWAGASLVRYADDFVVLARYQGDRLVNWIETTLEGRFGLTINREKTSVVRLGAIGGDGLDFLGFTLRYERSVLAGTDRYLHVGPSRKSLARAREKLRELTSSRWCFRRIDQIISSVNRFLRGWGEYFGYGHPRRAFAHLNWFTYDRVAGHLARRSQRSWQPPKDRTAYSQLYDILGLQRLTNRRKRRVC